MTTGRNRKATQASVLIPQHSWALQLSGCIPATDKQLHFAPGSLLSLGEPPTRKGWGTLGPRSSQGLGPGYLLISSQA